MRKEYVLDANAVLIYLEDRSGADRVRQLFQQVQNERAWLAMSVVNWGEVFYVLAKKLGEDRTRRLMQPLRKGIDLLPADATQAELAAAFKYKYRIAYAGGFAAALATTNRATLVTSDPDFDIFAPRVKIMRLPRQVS
ncbi:MAG TPA: type II toxin-antitoxin system VapC family toxin [Terriglobales bacterium]|nr:type II toxin-antitoxin system VapC family toxin [Terriglobales bacterium]